MADLLGVPSCPPAFERAGVLVDAEDPKARAMAAEHPTTSEIPEERSVRIAAASHPAASELLECSAAELEIPEGMFALLMGVTTGASEAEMAALKQEIIRGEGRVQCPRCRDWTANPVKITWGKHKGKTGCVFCEDPPRPELGKTNKWYGVCLRRRLFLTGRDRQRGIRTAATMQGTTVAIVIVLLAVAAFWLGGVFGPTLGFGPKTFGPIPEGEDFTVPADLPDNATATFGATNPAHDCTPADVTTAVLAARGTSFAIGSDVLVGDADPCPGVRKSLRISV